MKKRIMFSLGVTVLIVLIGGIACAEVIKLGAIYPFTGKMAVYGDDAKRALDLAMEQINADGGIGGKNIKFIYEDSGGTPKGGVSAARKLIEIDKVQGIVGGLFSSIVLAIKPILNTNKITLVTPLASSTKIYSDTKFVFSLSPTDNDVGYILAKYAIENLGKKTLGTLYMMNDSGIGSEKLLSKWWEHFGGKVLIHENFTPGSTDFRTQLTKIRKANPDVVFLNVTWKEGATVLKQRAEMKLGFQVIANSQVREPKMLELVKEGAEGIIFTSPHEGQTDEEKKMKDRYKKEFTAKYNQPPKIVGWRTYDCARVFFEAMKSGGTAGDSLRTQIRNVDIPGLFGRIRFREDGSAIKDIAVWHVKQGQFEKLNYFGHAP